MSESEQLLELIESAIVRHGGDLGGWTRLQDGALQLFDGRATLRVTLGQAPAQQANKFVHAHVLATLHEFDNEVLDACLIGIGGNTSEALQQAAMIWVTGVAGPIRSFIDSKPVCMACKAGVAGGSDVVGHMEGDYGLPGLNAYVGPGFSRGFKGEQIHAALNDKTPWFQYAAEAAAPRRIHMAKSTILSDGNNNWRRKLEIDGHEVWYEDVLGHVEYRTSEVGYITRFAVFEFPRDSAEMVGRADLERTIRHFAEHFPEYQNVDNLMNDMVKAGFDRQLVHETESIAMIAFGRVLFENAGVHYPPTIFRARCDGHVERDVPLISLPAYSRGLTIAGELKRKLTEEHFQMLGCYNAESQALLKALNQNENLSDVRMYPCVVPDWGVDQQTMDAAFRALTEMIDRARSARSTRPATQSASTNSAINLATTATTKKPWWKIW